jgi:hypothetical protein
LVTVLLSSTVCLAQAPPDWAFPGATWQTKTPAEMGLDSAKLDALKSSLTKSGTSITTGGVVIKDGYLVYRWNNDPNGHNWASGSNPVLSTMLFSGINEGRVGSVESNVYDWGWALRTEDRTMTFRHLADMTSGYAVAENPGQRWAYNDYAIQLYVDTLERVFGSSDLVAPGDARFTDPMQFQGGYAEGRDGDHAVAFSDLNVLACNWNQSATQRSDGDFDTNGVVEFGDLNTLAANWNWTKPAGGPVPEPGVLALLGAGGLALLRRRKT